MNALPPVLQPATDPAAYDRAAAWVQAQTNLRPTIGLVLGSGLDILADLVDQSVAIPYGDIPGFPVSTALGHKGELLLGKVAQQPILIMRGRHHTYEGWSPAQATFPVRVMHRLGIRILILTNAAGGLKPNFRVGQIMLIRDHIALPAMAGLNPLRGPNEDEFGDRFPAMNDAYSHQLVKLARAAAREAGTELREGVYVWVAGPNFETPAEIRMLRAWGGDAVGMSTVPETMIACHAGMEVLAFSTITNLCVDTLEATDRPDAEEVVIAGRAAGQSYAKLLRTLLPRL